MTTTGTDPVGETGEDDVAARALGKLRSFVESLDDDERAVVAALIAPGVASAYRDEDDEDLEVVGFGMQAWEPNRLPTALAGQIRDQNLRASSSAERGRLTSGRIRRSTAPAPSRWCRTAHTSGRAARRRSGCRSR